MNHITTRKQLLPLLISQVLAGSTQAAIFNVNCGQTDDLIDAIMIANNNGGADKINLNVDKQVDCVYPLTAVDNVIDGPNGLPSITSEITINGHQSTIRRLEGSAPFRIFHVAKDGQLVLRRLSVENGLLKGGISRQEENGGGIFNHGELTLEESTVSGNTASIGSGGGISNWDSSATLINSTVSGNTASKGGGISNWDSSATFTNSTISGNTAFWYGAGIYNSNSSATLTNSTVSRNTGAWSGGGILSLGDSSVTITNSTMSGNTANWGGGISNWDSSATFTNSTVSGNTAVWNGGGIYNIDSSATLLTNSTVSGNTVTFLNGGGISNTMDSTVMLTNSTVSGNTAGRNGGGIYDRESSAIFLTNSTVSGNTANESGGGIYNELDSSAMFINSTVSGNTAARNGGGIYNNWGSHATFTNSTVSGNTANESGGGIYNSNSSATLTNSTVSGNTANKFGGGIFNWDSSATLTNSTVSGNTANKGGGIYNDQNYGFNVTLINSTVFGNTANESGGGIFNYTYDTDYPSEVTLQNTILAGNTANTQPDCFNIGSTLNANHFNLLGGDGADCNAGANDLTLEDLGMTINDVLNPTLADNGGPTETLALVANSPAINAADDVVCPATDQRGVNRPIEGRCDIGAFEYQQFDLIELDDFEAIPTAQGFYLKWTTASEKDNAGFRIWQATQDQYGGFTSIKVLDNPQNQTLTVTPFEQVTDWSQTIPARGDKSDGQCYSYLDASVHKGKTTYFYLLEDINDKGFSTFHWAQIASGNLTDENLDENPQCE